MRETVGFFRKSSSDSLAGALVLASVPTVVLGLWIYYQSGLGSLLSWLVGVGLTLAAILGFGVLLFSLALIKAPFRLLKNALQRAETAEQTLAGKKEEEAKQPDISSLHESNTRLHNVVAAQQELIEKQQKKLTQLDNWSDQVTPIVNDYVEYQERMRQLATEVLPQLQALQADRHGRRLTSDQIEAISSTAKRLLDDFWQTNWPNETERDTFIVRLGTIGEETELLSFRNDLTSALTAGGFHVEPEIWQAGQREYDAVVGLTIFRPIVNDSLVWPLVRTAVKAGWPDLNETDEPQHQPRVWPKPISGRLYDTRSVVAALVIGPRSR